MSTCTNNSSDPGLVRANIYPAWLLSAACRPLIQAVFGHQTCAQGKQIQFNTGLSQGLLKNPVTRVGGYWFRSLGQCIRSPGGPVKCRMRFSGSGVGSQVMLTLLAYDTMSSKDLEQGVSTLAAQGFLGSFKISQSPGFTQMG